MTLLEEGVDRRAAQADLFGVTHSSSGVANSSVGAEGQTGSAARYLGSEETGAQPGRGTTRASTGARPGVPTDSSLIARLEAERYGTWQQAYEEVYGR